MNIFHAVAPSVVFINTFDDIPSGNNERKDKEQMKRMQMQWRKRQDRLKKNQERYVHKFLHLHVVLSQNIKYDIQWYGICMG